MFWRSPERIKGAVYAIVAASVPTEVCSNDADDWSQLWCYNFLLRFSKELGLPESKACAYVPMILTESPYQSVSCERRGELVKPYLEILNDGDVVILEAYIFVLMFLVEEGFMDGRGRILLRNLLLSLNLSNYDGVWIENILLQYLVAQQVQIDKSKEKRRNKYRYMKIGAVALGAGAVLAVTGGMAAPAVAGALVLMGYSAATAATVAGSMAMLFGGTGAGLAGYKMIKRTRGLTDFEFQSFDAKNRIAVIIMVSGWMEEDEDDKRTFGVIPDQMPLKERLARYYQLYAPERLADVSREAWNYRTDPEAIFAELRERYGKDPEDDTCLVPPLPQPDADSAESYLYLITKCFASIARELERGEGEGASAGGAGGGDGGRGSAATAGGEQHQKSKSAFDFARTPGQSEEGGGEGGDSSAAQDQEAINAALSEALAAVSVSGKGVAGGGKGVGAEEEQEEQEEEEVGAAASTDATGEDSAAALAEWDAELKRQSAAGEPMHLSDDFRYWHWRELSISPVYEITLLRWEKQLQKDLGKSILSLITSLSTSAAQKALQYTVLSAVLAAVALPVFLLQLLSVIDNLWILAVERADQAGRELAKALLERPHGKRPVTLVGYSMGCRVIFSCLKELARHLDLPPAPPGEDGDTGDADDDVAAKDASADDTQDADGGGGDKGDGAADGSAAVGKSESKRSTPNDNDIPAKQSANDTPSNAPANTTTAGKILGHAGALKRGMFSLGGKIISPLTSRGKAADTDTSGGKGGDGDEGGKSAGKKAATKMEAKDLKGLIGDVVLLGAPVDLRDKHWPRVRALVSGRLINGYSRKDLVLSVIYRYQRIKIGVCGIAPVKVAGVENINLTHIVTQHIHYCSKMKEILEEINLSSSVPYTAYSSSSNCGAFET